MTKKYGYRLNKLGPALLVTVFALFMTLDSVTADAATTPADAQEISLTEAKILLYVSPIGEEVRAEGYDIAMERQTSDKLNQADYYTFWVYNDERQSYGSVTIGYFAVNKHTAQVWDTVEDKQLSGKLLLGVQKMFRESHHIDGATIKKYSASPFWKSE